MRYNYLLRSVGYCLSAAFLLAVATSGDALAAPPDHAKGEPQAGQNSPLVIKEQGGFSFAGKVEINQSGPPDINTYSRHCDHGYANFSIPMNARKNPIIMWHSTHVKTWESNPSFMGGHQAFQDIFLRRDWGVYIIDLPRQGLANYGCFAADFISNWPQLGRDRSFVSWRLGTWTPPGPPTYFPGSRMAPLDTNGELINQILRARYPDNEHVPDAFPLEADSVGKLLDMIGPAILFTHSGSGYPGLADRNQESEGGSCRQFRDGLCVPDWRSPAWATGGAARRLPEAHEDTDCYHPGRQRVATGDALSRAGVRGEGEQPRRKCQTHLTPRAGHPRQ
jgi:hypothetical protein